MTTAHRASRWKTRRRRSRQAGERLAPRQPWMQWPEESEANEDTQPRREQHRARSALVHMQVTGVGSTRAARRPQAATPDPRKKKQQPAGRAAPKRQDAIMIFTTGDEATTVNGSVPTPGSTKDEGRQARVFLICPTTGCHTRAPHNRSHSARPHRRRLGYRRTITQPTRRAGRNGQRGIGCGPRSAATAGRRPGVRTKAGRIRFELAEPPAPASLHEQEASALPQRSRLTRSGWARSPTRVRVWVPQSSRRQRP